MQYSSKHINDATVKDYHLLTNNQHTVLRNHGARYKENAVEFYEELRIDLDKAMELSELLIDNGINSKLKKKVNIQELVFMLLYFGIGVPCRSVREINILFKEYNEFYLFNIVGRHHNNDSLEHDLNVISDELYKSLNYNNAFFKTL